MDIPAILPSAPMVEKAPKSGETSMERAAPKASHEAVSTEDSAARAPKTQDLALDELEQVVETLNVQAQMIHRNLQFSVDDGSGRTVITLSDSQSGEVIRQIPSEALLRLAQRLADKAPGASSAGDLSAGRARTERVADAMGTLLDTEL